MKRSTQNKVKRIESAIAQHLILTQGDFCHRQLKYDLYEETQDKWLTDCLQCIVPFPSFEHGAAVIPGVFHERLIRLIESPEMRDLPFDTVMAFCQGKEQDND